MAPFKAFTLAFLLFFGLSFAQDPIHIPLTRRSRVHRAFNPAEEVNRVKVKYGLADETTQVHRGRRASSVGVPIINQDMDSSYLGTITVGTPPQTFNVDLDTGSADLWLAATSCHGCLPSTSHYVPSQSSTFQGTGKQGNISLGQNVTIGYADGPATGISVADTVTMGGLKISSQIFLSVDKVASGIINGSDSGVMGLAFTSLAFTNATPFWEALVNNNQLCSPEMSFWLNRSTDTQHSEVAGGVFTLGGTDSSLFSGAIEFLDVKLLPLEKPYAYWTLLMSAVSVGGQSVKISTGTDAFAIMDTGSTLVYGPTADVKAIWNAVPGSAPSQGMQGFFQFPCTTVVNISLSFGGRLWPISSQDMNLGPASQGNSQCLGAIADLGKPSGSPGPSWVLGDTFLKNVYTVLRATNPPSVGFAQLSNLATAGENGARWSAGANSPVSTKPTA